MDAGQFAFNIGSVGHAELPQPLQSDHVDQFQPAGSRPCRVGGVQSSGTESCYRCRRHSCCRAARSDLERLRSRRRSRIIGCLLLSSEVCDFQPNQKDDLDEVIPTRPMSGDSAGGPVPLFLCYVLALAHGTSTVDRLHQKRIVLGLYAACLSG